MIIFLHLEHSYLSIYCIYEEEIKKSFECSSVLKYVRELNKIFAGAQ